MLFGITHSAMNSSETVLNMLDALLTRVEDDVHELEVVDADLLENSAWYKSSRSDRRNLLEKSAKALLHRSPRTRGPHLRRIEVTDEKTANAARSIAHTPLDVLVENRESDGALVKTALKVFGTPAAWELCFGSGAQRSPPAMRIDSEGGHGELEKSFRRHLADAANRGVEQHIIVMIDCDGEWIGDIKVHAKTIRDQCLEAGVPCPTLNKRTAENYIPDAVWKAWAGEARHINARPAIEALLRLSYRQRDHVRIAGSNTDPWDSSNPVVASLFAGVPAGDRDLLKQANLKGRGSTAIASLLETHEVAATRAEFQARDNDGDLEALVRCIEDEL
jgi:hypothetical protein